MCDYGGQRIVSSFYMMYPMDNDVVEGREPYIPAQDVSLPDDFSSDNDFKFTFCRGFIHTGKTLTPMEELKPLNNMEVYRCIIPKGTEYIEGIDDDCNGSYASKQIMFKELVFMKDNSGNIQYTT